MTIRKSVVLILLAVATFCFLDNHSTAQNAAAKLIRCNKIVFFGNSITCHGPKADIGWSGNWGMAATAQANDYVHCLIAKMDTFNNSKLAVDRSGDTEDGSADNIFNIAGVFERNYANFSISALQTQIDYQPDVVVLQFGENMAPVQTDSEKAAFKASLSQLMSGFRQHGNPVFFVTSNIISSNNTIDAIKQEVCNEDPTHRIFVDLSDLRKDPTNYASGEYVEGNPFAGRFTHTGVLAHPGNKGMQFIADRLYVAIANRLSTENPTRETPKIQSEILLRDHKISESSITKYDVQKSQAAIADIKLSSCQSYGQ